MLATSNKELSLDAGPTAIAHCPVCLYKERVLAASWTDWEASLQNRPDGPMRLAAGRASGIAELRPDLMRCPHCGTVGMSVLPSREQLESFYGNYHMTGGFLAKTEKKVARARKRLRFLKPLAPQRAPRRFLEVGASIGTAAEAARRAGLEAHAVEIDPDAISEGTKLFPGAHFTQGRLENVDGEERFELIYGAEVIEHVRDPARFLDHCQRLLVPGGLLYLTTPDCGHRLRPKRLLDWHSVKPPEHIHLFTKRGMRAILHRSGFQRQFLPPHTKPGMRVLAWKDR